MFYRFAMAIGRLYHVIHIVDDLDVAQSFYGSVFPLETYTDHEWSDTDKRLASLSIITDNFVIELIQPSHAEEDLQVSLPKFAHKFGSRLHSMAWFSDDVPALATRFEAAGIRVLGGGYGTIFTHPKDTFGQLQFQTGPPEVPVPDPRLVPGWASTANREHPLGLVRASHVTTMVSDLDAAANLYRGPLDGQLLHAARRRRRVATRSSSSAPTPSSIWPSPCEPAPRCTTTSDATDSSPTRSPSWCATSTPRAATSPTSTYRSSTWTSRRC